MATAYVTFADVGDFNVPSGTTARTSVVTTSNTAAATVLAALGAQVALVYCATAVYARAGDTVTVATGVYIPAGVQTAIKLAKGQTVSLIDV